MELDEGARGPKDDTPKPAVALAVTAVFSALVAVGTMLVIPLPRPLAELTLAPPIYLSLAVLSDRWTAFNATALGSFIGEAVNGALYGYPFIYALGIVWARAPEALIVAWARRKGNRALAAAMVGATAFETLAFYFSDAAFYAYGLFGYCVGVSNCFGALNGLILALPDLGTMADLLFIPVALAIVIEAKPAFRRVGFG